MRDVMYDFPDNYTCVCGSGSYMKLIDIHTDYNGKTFVVRRVPVFECNNGHIKLSRICRITMKDLLRYAWDNDESEVYYYEGDGDK